MQSRQNGINQSSNGKFANRIANKNTHMLLNNNKNPIRFSSEIVLAKVKHRLQNYK